MQLIIAEKPSMANDIASALGGFSKKRGYMQNDKYILSWTIGHLVELVPPEEYRVEWKNWRAESLPIIPQEFKLRAIKKTESQVDLLKRLASDKRVTSCINACDAGREGELIFRYVMQLIDCHKPTKRLWISSLTASAIKKGFLELEEQQFNDASFQMLYDSAKCRSEADWLVGINASRAVTVRQRQVGQKVLYSLGRVQTPTLAILVDREHEIAEFVARDFWKLEGIFHTKEIVGGNDELVASWFHEDQHQFWQRDDLDKVMEKLLVNGLPKESCIQSIFRKERNEQAPLLFDLTSLQREANRRYGYSASRTLKAAQTLYERHKLISYPRTDSRFITPDLIPSLRQRMQAGCVGSPYQTQVEYALNLPKLPISGRIVNINKVRDHHAIIPTEVKVNWKSMHGDELRILELIHQAFIGVFLPVAVWHDTEIIITCQSEQFRTKKASLIEPGWRLLHNSQAADVFFEHLREGDILDLVELHEMQDETKPPPRYTEGALLGAMERAGRFIDDEALQEVMKENGLGTAATRAAIIERLKQINYLYEHGKDLVPSSKGIALIDNLPVESLRSPELTGKWEARLRAIQSGKDDAPSFMKEMEQFIKEITASCLTGLAFDHDEANEIRNKAKANFPKTAISEQETSDYGVCPLCGGIIKDNRKAFYCSNWRGEKPCKFTIWKTIARKTLTPNQVMLLISKGKTGILKGFRAKNGAPFDARLVMQDGQVVMEIVPREKKKKTAERS